MAPSKIVTVLEALLLRARDFDANARRWSLLVVVALAVFHATAVTSWVERDAARAARSEELARLDGVLADVRELGPALASVPATVHEVMDPALGRLVEDLRRDLLRLRSTRRSLRRFMAEQNAGDDAAPAEDLLAEVDDELAGVEPFEVQNVDWIVEIGEALGREELLRALSPLVDERVVAPRFAAVRQLWTASALPRIEAHLDGVAAAVPELRGRYGEAASDYQALAEALTAERRAARDLEVAPPERPYWWASEEPPAAGSDEVVVLALEPAVVEQLLAPVALDHLRVAVERTGGAYETLYQRLETRRTALTGGTETESLDLDLGRLVRAFPLILGLVAGVLLLTAARRLRELGYLVHLLAAEGGTATLRPWLSSLGRWSSSAGPEPALQGGGRRISILTLAALAWIGGAAAQLLGPGTLPPVEVAAVAGGGFLAVLLAAGYYLAVVRGLRRLPGPTVPRAGEPAVDEEDTPAGEDDGDVLDVHQLKR